jgi:hypothetical protein
LDRSRTSEAEHFARRSNTAGFDRTSTTKRLPPSSRIPCEEQSCTPRALPSQGDQQPPRGSREGASACADRFRGADSSTMMARLAPRPRLPPLPRLHLSAQSWESTPSLQFRTRASRPRGLSPLSNPQLHSPFEKEETHKTIPSSSSIVVTLPSILDYSETDITFLKLYSSNLQSASAGNKLHLIKTAL